MKAKEVYVLLNTEADGTLLLSPPQVTELSIVQQVVLLDCLQT